MVLNPLNEVYLSAKLDHSTYLAGDCVQCEVDLNTDKLDNEWSITDLVGQIVGQYRIHEKCFEKFNIVFSNSIKPNIFEKNFSFNAQPLFDSCLDPASRISLLLPMHLTILNSRKVKVCAQLPRYIPPTCRGSLFRLTYRMLLAVQYDISESKLKSTLIQVPIRVLPFPFLETDNNFMTSEVLKESSSLITNPFLADESELVIIDELNEESIEEMDGLENNGLTKNAGQIRFKLLHETQSMGKNHSKSSSSLSFMTSITASVFKDFQKVSNCFNLSQTPKAVNFMISTPRGHVGRLSFFRTFYGLSDVIRGYLNFEDSNLSCVGCSLQLESEEQFFQCLNTNWFTNQFLENSEFICQNYLSKKQKDELECVGFVHYTKCADIYLNCISKRALPFALPIPTNLTPQFFTFARFKPPIALDYRWRLRIEFELAVGWDKSQLNGTSTTAKSLHDHGQIWSLPTKMKTEKFIWDLPIQLISSNSVIMNIFDHELTTSICISK